LAVDDDAVYVGQSHAIFTTPRNSLSAEQNPAVAWTLLAAAEDPLGIALDETHVYFSGPRLSRVDKRGGAVEVLSDRPTGAVTTSGGFVYFSDDVPGELTTIRRFSSETGTELVTELRDGGRLERLVVDANFVYALHLGAQPARAWRIDIENGTQEIIVPRIDVARGFDVAAGFFYFSEEGTRSIQKVPIEGGEPSIVATFRGYPYDVVTNGSVIYAILMDLDPDTNAYSAHVIRLNADGSEACVVGNTSGVTWALGELLLYDDSAFYTGQCGTNGTM
jgi:hypothetical protein